MIRSKLCRNYAFPQNFYTRKLGEITAFYAVKDSLFYVIYSLIFHPHLFTLTYLITSLNQRLVSSIEVVPVDIICSSHPEAFLEKGVLKICSKFTGEHQCRSVARHGCSPVNLLHILRTPLTKNTSGRLLLIWYIAFYKKCFLRKPLTSNLFIKKTYQRNCFLIVLYNYIHCLLMESTRKRRSLKKKTSTNISDSVLY